MTQTTTHRSPGRRPRLLYLVTEDWYFCSHRLVLACAARDAGFDVVVATRVKDHGERIRAAGLKLVPIHLSRRSTNPARELAFLWDLLRVYREERPDIVHHVAVKPVLYGSFVAKLSRVPSTVNALAGMGYVFTSSKPKARLLKPFVARAYRWAMSGESSRLIVQNPHDAELLRGLGAITRETGVSLIRGSGVEVSRYPVSPEPGGMPVVVLPARMLWDKGVAEFVEAAQLLQARGIAARFVLVGEADDENPAAIPQAQLETWNRQGTVEWWGFRDDMPTVLAGAHIVCLPSYREGLPKSLVEGACAGRPLVAADVPGCREIVRDADNGLLVPARQSGPLADALERLIKDPPMRQRMGARGRERVIAEFSAERVIDQTLALYRELWEGKDRCAA